MNEMVQGELPFEEEIWKDIPGIPTHQASSMGRIRSKDRIDQMKTRSGKTVSRKRNGIILNQQKAYNGYLLASVNDKTRSVHRLVAMAFLGTSSDKDVNHKNGTKTDNRPENLEWVTSSENERHSYDVLGKQVWNKGKSAPQISRAKMGHSVSPEQIEKQKATWRKKRILLERIA